MEFLFSLTYPGIFFGLVGVISAVVWYRLRWYQLIVYNYSAAGTLLAAGYAAGGGFQKILKLLRILSLLLLALLIAKPRIIDYQSIIPGQGIDMILVLDVSNSMSIVDDPAHPQTRLEVAKQEAIRFIDKREGDPIGLVIFGKVALSRCPTTLDKNILKSIINDITIGTINGEGTALNTGIIMAVNRLKDAKGMSKVMVVLTDGLPLGDEATVEQAIAVAKKYGIKIYTIGIGEEVVYINTLFGPQPMKGIDKECLQKIAQETDGRFFEAKKPSDMQAIYNTIDQLEKRDYETTIFNHYYDIFKPFLIAVVITILIELILSSFIWFIL